MQQFVLEGVEVGGCTGKLGKELLGVADGGCEGLLDFFGVLDVG
jgi:hypothetical protein